MALGLTSISMTAVYAELAGSSSPIAAITTPAKPWLLSALCAVAGQSPWSFYGTGTLGVDASKNVVWTAPSTAYKLGDFRKYNHGAVLPSAANDFQWDWGPGGSNTSPGITSLPGEMNVLFVNSSALYITYKAYLSSANRAAETSVHDSYTELATYNTITAMAGHTRTQTKQIAGTHIGTFVNLSTVGLATPNDLVYLDTYFSDISGNRLVNLGTVANGYTTITMHEKQNPWVDSSGTCVSRPGYTGSHTEINNVAASCTGADVPLTFGSTAYSFYLRAVGISAGTYNINPTNCTIRIRHYESNGTTIRETITLTGQSLETFSKNGKQFSGNVTNSFAYDEFLEVDITVVSSWGTARIC